MCYCIWFSALDMLAGVFGSRKAGRVHTVSRVISYKGRTVTRTSNSNMTFKENALSKSRCDGGGRTDKIEVSNRFY